MSVVEKLADFFEVRHIPYRRGRHPVTKTALETAHRGHVREHQFAKVVILQVKHEDLMFVIPADHELDSFKLAMAFHTADFHLEEEGRLPALFPGCETGAMPPFGNLFQIPCFVDKALLENEYLVFNAGSHTEVIRMKTEDYLALSEANTGEYSVSLRHPGNRVIF